MKEQFDAFADGGIITKVGNPSDFLDTIFHVISSETKHSEQLYEVLAFKLH